MGQAFRRAAGRMGSPRVDAAPPSQLKKPLDGRTPAKNVPMENSGSTSKSTPEFISNNVFEQRDLKYDAMLSQMMGRIRTKPGGKPEMGEASVAENYSRPLPKLRNTTPESSRYEERPTPPGTINVAKLRHMLLLYHGKADEHEGPMDVPQIAEKFRLRATEVKAILQHVSLPIEDNKL